MRLLKLSVKVVRHKKRFFFCGRLWERERGSADELRSFGERDLGRVKGEKNLLISAPVVPAFES